MPLLNKKPFVARPPPDDLQPEEEVFVCHWTNEAFRDYEYYVDRTIQCSSLIWSCELTGKSGLTYREAVESEKEAKRQIDAFPDALRRAVLFLASQVRRSGIGLLVEDTFAFYRDRYVEGEEVEVSYCNHRLDARIVSVCLSDHMYEANVADWHGGMSYGYKYVAAVVGPHPNSFLYGVEYVTSDVPAGYQHIRMYDVNATNPNPVINYDGLSKNVMSIGFEKTGKWMFTGGEDKTAKIWDLRVRNIQCQRIFQMNDPCTCICLHPNQVEMMVGDQSGAIHLWDLRTDHNEQVVPEPDIPIRTVSIDPDASYMAACSNNGNCYVWSLLGGRGNDRVRLKPKTKVPAHPRYALKCQFSPDSCLLATASADKSVKIWNTADFSLRTTLSTENQQWVWDCAFSADSQYLVTASSDGVARLWNIDHGDVKREYQGHQKAIVSLAFYDGSAPV